MWLRLRKFACSLFGHDLFHYTTSSGIQKADCTYCGAENVELS